jgi:hypothetical protein
MRMVRPNSTELLAANGPMPATTISVIGARSLAVGHLARGLSFCYVLGMEVRSVEAIVRALNAAEAQYLIVGGLAVNAHGYERLTQDIDLVIRLTTENVVRGLRALGNIGYRMPIPVTPEQFADAANREAWRKEKNMTVLRLWSDLHRRTPVDVFVYGLFISQTNTPPHNGRKSRPTLKRQSSAARP